MHVVELSYLTHQKRGPGVAGAGKLAAAVDSFSTWVGSHGVALQNGISAERLHLSFSDTAADACFGSGSWHWLATPAAAAVA